MSFDPERISKFQTKIFKWWKTNKREFPWRETTDPYYIMISEFMLQQTQTMRVVPKYLEFIERFPTPKDLGNAEKIDVLRLWSGLGYNRRAIWLQDAARTVAEMEEFPSDPTELRKLKGIGRYSSNSILIFAFNADLTTIDTNIRKIFVDESFLSPDATESHAYMVANQLLPHGKSRDWHNALMDYGAAFYSKKSPSNGSTRFAGSKRQIRGKIIKLLTKGTPLSVKKLQAEIKHEELESILEDLVKDGLIQKINGKYSI